ncbi:hypothetical protein GCM10029976_048790 [Kribbella albertanoniae]
MGGTANDPHTGQEKGYPFDVLVLGSNNEGRTGNPSGDPLIFRATSTARTVS